MKEINIFAMTNDGAVQVAMAVGEAMLDPDQGVLIIYGKSLETTMTFNWDNLLSYTESPYAPADAGE